MFDFVGRDRLRLPLPVPSWACLVLSSKISTCLCKLQAHWLPTINSDEKFIVASPVPPSLAVAAPGMHPQHCPSQDLRTRLIFYFSTAQPVCCENNNFVRKLIHFYCHGILTSCNIRADSSSSAVLRSISPFELMIQMPGFYVSPLGITSCSCRGLPDPSRSSSRCSQSSFVNNGIFVVYFYLSAWLVRAK